MNCALRSMISYAGNTGKHLNVIILNQEQYDGNFQPEGAVRRSNAQQEPSKH